MSKLFNFALCISISYGCSHPTSVVRGKRFSLAKGNIAFVLPDSSLTYSKPLLWGADYNGGEYGETGAFYYNQDSTTIISVYVKACPNAFRGRTPWRIIANEQEARRTVLAKNYGLAVIESYQVDSLTRTIAISYRLANKLAPNRQGRPSYNKRIHVYGHHRDIGFWLSGPDNPTTRQQFVTIQASIRVTPAFLQDTVAPHQSSAMRD